MGWAWLPLVRGAVRKPQLGCKLICFFRSTTAEGEGGEGEREGRRGDMEVYKRWCGSLRSIDIFDRFYVLSLDEVEKRCEDSPGFSQLITATNTPQYAFRGELISLIELYTGIWMRITRKICVYFSTHNRHSALNCTSLGPTLSLSRSEIVCVTFNPNGAFLAGRSKVIH